MAKVEVDIDRESTWLCPSCRVAFSAKDKKVLRFIKVGDFECPTCGAGLAFVVELFYNDCARVTSKQGGTP